MSSDTHYKCSVLFMEASIESRIEVVYGLLVVKKYVTFMWLNVSVFVCLQTLADW